jgi:hypothetical protein
LGPGWCRVCEEYRCDECGGEADEEVCLCGCDGWGGEVVKALGRRAAASMIDACAVESREGVYEAWSISQEPQAGDWEWLEGKLGQRSTPDQIHSFVAGYLAETARLTTTEGGE